MKIFMCILLLLLSVNLCNSQSNKEYLFSSEIKALYNTDTVAKNYQHYAVNYMNIGNYKDMLFLEEEFVLKFKGLNHKKRTVNGSFFSYKAVNALQEIVKKASKHQLVIINEAHFSAQNRVFTRAVIKKLKSKGFTTLFVEDLVSEDFSYTDKLLNTRKYPLIATGYYMKEPQYGNMIRKALQLNYKVFPYEFIPNNSIKDPMKRWSARESGQANNILKYLKKYPKEKIIIHCGYGHLGEKLYEEGLGMMGALLKKKSGIDPFTISQTMWLETFSNKTKNPYRKIIDRKLLNDISVFKNHKGELYSSDKENYDVEVYFPNTKYIKGRPDWLLLGKGKKYVDVPFEKIKLKYPYLVFAYHKDEIIAETVPTDIIEIKDINDQKSLILEKGNYTLLVQNIKREIQKISIKVK